MLRRRAELTLSTGSWAVGGVEVVLVEVGDAYGGLRGGRTWLAAEWGTVEGVCVLEVMVSLL